MNAHALIRNTLTAGLLLLSAIASAQVNVNVGDIPPNSSVTVRFRVQVDSNINATQIVNQASVSGSNFSATQSRDPDVPSGGEIFVPFPTFTEIQLPPLVITCPSNTTVECDDDISTNALGSATVSDGTGCMTGSLTLTYSDVTNAIGCAGTITRTWQAANGCGNTTTCDQVITLIDTTAPVINCPGTFTTGTDSNTCSANVTFPVPTATDNCDTNVTIACSPMNGSSFLPGTSTVECVATDACGNSSTCSYDVVVLDLQPPALIDCVENQSVILAVDSNCTVALPNFAPAGIEEEEGGSDVGFPAPIFTDACDDDSLSYVQTPAVDSLVGPGTTTVSVVATDTSGNSNTCSFEVLVVDRMPPTIICPANVEIECNGDTSPSSTGAALGLDNCGNPAISFSDSTSSGSCPTNSVLSRVWTATDNAGLQASCTQTISIVDTTAPAFNCPSNIVVCADSNSCSAIVTFPTNAVTDNCDNAPTVAYTPNSGSSFDVGTNIVTAIASDSCGNTSTCSFEVVVNDCQAPTVTSCPSTPFALAANTNCMASVPNFTISEQENEQIPDRIIIFRPPSFADNCTPSFLLQLSQTPEPASLITVGTTAVSVVATDLAGNSATCTFDLVVTDTLSPVITCPSNVVVECDASTLPVSTGMATATDNCGTPAITFNDSFINGEGCPQDGEIRRTWTATDAAGNQTHCDQYITIVDTIPPVPTCPSDIVVTNDIGVAGATVTFVVSATDNCSTGMVVSAPASGSLFPLGTTTVTNTVSDACGNSTSCTFTVTVVKPVDLIVSKTADLDPAFNGNDLTYTITVTNAGPREAENVVVTDILSDYVTPNATVVTNIGSIASGESTSFNLTVAVAVPTGTVSVVLTNLVSVSSDGDELNPADNTNTLETAALGLARLTLLDDPNGFGTISGATNGLYLVNSMFDLYPEGLVDKFGFLSWETNGVAAATNNPLSITLVEDMTVQVFFESLFIDVTDEVTGELSNWSVDYSTGIFYSDLTICNTATIDVHLIEPFWYAYPSNATQFLIAPDGMTNNVPYIDITTNVNAKLPLQGNNDLSLDTNECVTIGRIAWYQSQLVPFTGTVFAVYADPPGDPVGPRGLRDTDRDGILNFWEDRHGLNKNHAFDGPLDSDRDGVSNNDEFDADTVPNDAGSKLRLREIVPGQRIRWQGGVEVDQYLDWAPSPAGPWITILTNSAPTAVEEIINFAPSENEQGYYRVRVGNRATGDVQ